MPISAFPAANPFQILSPAGQVAAWLTQQAGFFPSGTEALYWAYRGLGVTSGVVLHLPSYNCGVEVQAALDCGASVECYATRPDLSHDVDDLERHLRARPGPVVAIHYFGFPQPELARIAALCRELQVPWIADCAHALFSMAATMSPPAPVAIYSLHKTLGIFDGGTLQVDPAELAGYTAQPFIAPPAGRFYSRPYFAAAKTIARSLMGEQLTRLYRRWRFRDGTSPEPVDASNGATPDGGVHPMFVVDYGRRMSALSHRLASSQNAARIAAARRMHYTFLADSLADTAGFNPVFSHLPADVCPLVLPIWVTHRERVLAALQAAGIEPFIFGEYAHPAMPGGDPITPHLRAHILGLPVHQLLTAPELEKISGTLHPLLKHHALEPLGTPAHV